MTRTDALALALYFPARPFVSRAPARMLDSLARLGGAIAPFADGRTELEALFGDRPLPAPADAIVREAKALAIRNELEVLRYDRIDGRAIALEGKEHLDAALSRGKGVIVALAHFGAHQLVMPALGHRGYAMNQLSAPPTVWAGIRGASWARRQVFARRWVLEQALPAKHIDVFRFLRPAFRCLERNEVLGLAFDGGGGTQFRGVELLARRANLAQEPVELWARSGAALLTAVVVRPLGARQHRVVLEPVSEGASLQTVVGRFERWIARYPAHYLPFVMLRKAVRGTDLVPFFDGWPADAESLSPEAARERLRRAGAARG